MVLPIYPLAPVGSGATVVPEMADLLTQLIDQHASQNVSVLGDSAGGGLALAAVQQLVLRGEPTPGSMVFSRRGSTPPSATRPVKPSRTQFSMSPRYAKMGCFRPATSTRPIRSPARSTRRSTGFPRHGCTRAR